MKRLLCTVQGGLHRHCEGPSICTVDIKGLLKVVPEHGGGDKGNDYCIDGFAIDRYWELLTYCQQMFPDLCTQTVFVKTYQLVSAYVSNDLSAISTNITTLVFSSVLNMGDIIYYSHIHGLDL